MTGSVLLPAARSSPARQAGRRASAHKTAACARSFLLFDDEDRPEGGSGMAIAAGVGMLNRSELSAPISESTGGRQATATAVVHIAQLQQFPAPLGVATKEMQQAPHSAAAPPPPPPAGAAATPAPKEQPCSHDLDIVPNSVSPCLGSIDHVPQTPEDEAVSRCSSPVDLPATVPAEEFFGPALFSSSAAAATATMPSASTFLNSSNVVALLPAAIPALEAEPDAVALSRHLTAQHQQPPATLASVQGCILHHAVARFDATENVRCSSQLTTMQHSLLHSFNDNDSSLAQAQVPLRPTAAPSPTRCGMPSVPLLTLQMSSKLSTAGAQPVQDHGTMSRLLPCAMQYSTNTASRFDLGWCGTANDNEAVKAAAGSMGMSSHLPPCSMAAATTKVSFATRLQQVAPGCSGAPAGISDAPSPGSLVTVAAAAAAPSDASGSWPVVSSVAAPAITQLLDVSVSVAKSPSIGQSLPAMVGGQGPELVAETPVARSGGTRTSTAASTPYDDETYAQMDAFESDHRLHVAQRQEAPLACSPHPMLLGNWEQALLPAASVASLQLPVSSHSVHTHTPLSDAATVNKHCMPVRTSAAAIMAGIVGIKSDDRASTVHLIHHQLTEHELDPKQGMVLQVGNSRLKQWAPQAHLQAPQKHQQQAQWLQRQPQQALDVQQQTPAGPAPIAQHSSPVTSSWAARPPLSLAAFPPALVPQALVTMDQPVLPLPTHHVIAQPTPGHSLQLATSLSSHEAAGLQPSEVPQPPQLPPPLQPQQQRLQQEQLQQLHPQFQQQFQQQQQQQQLQSQLQQPGQLPPRQPPPPRPEPPSHPLHPHSCPQQQPQHHLDALPAQAQPQPAQLQQQQLAQQLPLAQPHQQQQQPPSPPQPLLILQLSACASPQSPQVQLPQHPVQSPQLPPQHIHQQQPCAQEQPLLPQKLWHLRQVPSPPPAPLLGCPLPFSPQHIARHGQERAWLLRDAAGIHGTLLEPLHHSAPIGSNHADKSPSGGPVAASGGRSSTPYSAGTFEAIDRAVAEAHARRTFAQAAGTLITEAQGDAAPMPGGPGAVRADFAQTSTHVEAAAQDSPLTARQLAFTPGGGLPRPTVASRSGDHRPPRPPPCGFVTIGSPQFLPRTLEQAAGVPPVSQLPVVPLTDQLASTAFAAVDGAPAVMPAPGHAVATPRDAAAAEGMAIKCALAAGVGTAAAIPSPSGPAQLATGAAAAASAQASHGSSKGSTRTLAQVSAVQKGLPAGSSLAAEMAAAGQLRRHAPLHMTERLTYGGSVLQTAAERHAAETAGTKSTLVAMPLPAATDAYVAGAAALPVQGAAGVPNIPPGPLICTVTGPHEDAAPQMGAGEELGSGYKLVAHSDIVTADVDEDDRVDDDEMVDADDVHIDVAVVHQAEGHGHPSQRHQGSLASTQPPDPRKLSTYLPAEICEVYRQAGLTKDLYQWQGRALVYCAPTSGGKSLVAEILAIRRLIFTSKPFMLVLPLVALCEEKRAHLDRLLAPMHHTVNANYGGKGSGLLLPPNTGAVVCTFEAANRAINRMLEDDSLGQLGAVIVDELHMCGDEDRGYLLETMLTKLRYATELANDGLDGDGDQNPEGLQIIGMSATMPNVDVVAHWLGAELFITTFRPVELKNYIKVGKAIKDEHLNTVRELTMEPGWDSRDKDLVALLVKETVDEGNSVLVFCATRDSCQATANLVARLITVPERRTVLADRLGPEFASRDAILSRLPADSDLHTAMRNGCGWHHAGLSQDEKDLVEGAYKCGAVSVLMATPSLAAGVNLPARRVIFRQPYIGRADMPLDATRYRQMCGRAGRAGIDTHGESILIPCANYSAERLATKVMRADCAPIESCLTDDKRGMQRLLNEVVAADVVRTAKDVNRLVRCTLLAASRGFQDVSAAAVAALHKLQANKFIEYCSQTACWLPRPLGKATMASWLSPEEAQVVQDDLTRARNSFVMTTDLHLTYLVTPVNDEVMQRINWGTYMAIFTSLPGPEASVAKRVGVKGHLLQDRAQYGVRRAATAVQKEELRVAQRFFAALVLHELVQERRSQDVADKYGVHRGMLSGLQERAGKFAGTVAQFCNRLGWLDLEMLVVKFQGRVGYGVKPEIVALTEIQYVKGTRARLLYQHGLRTPEDVAAASADFIAEVISRGATAGSEEQARRSNMAAARLILSGARELMSKRAQELKGQANLVLAAIQQSSQPALSSLATQPRLPLHQAVTAPFKLPSITSTDTSGKAVSDDGSRPKSDSTSSGRGAGSHPVLASSRGVRVAGLKRRSPLGGDLGPGSAQKRACNNSAVQSIQQVVQEGLTPVIEGARLPTPSQPPQPPLPRPAEQQPAQQQALVMEPQQFSRQAVPALLQMGEEVPQQQQQQQQQQEAPVIETATAVAMPVVPCASSLTSLDTRGVREVTLLHDVQQLCKLVQKHGRFGFALDFAIVEPALGMLGSAVPIRLQLPDAGKARGGTGGGNGSHRSGSDCGSSVAVAGTPGNATIDGIAISVQDGAAFYVPLRSVALLADAGSSAHSAGGETTATARAATALEENMAEISGLLSCPCTVKVTYALKAQLGVLLAVAESVNHRASNGGGSMSVVAPEGALLVPRQERLTLAGPLVDVRIAAWVLGADCRDLQEQEANRGRTGRKSMAKSLEELMEERCGAFATAAALWNLTVQGDNPNVSLRRLDACKRATLACSAYRSFLPRMQARWHKAAPTRTGRCLALSSDALEQAEGLLESFFEVEMPMCHVLGAMEAAGVSVNVEVLAEQREPLLKRLQQLEWLAQRSAGTSFCLTNPSEVSNLLFRELKLPPPPQAKLKKSSNFSVREEVLEELVEQHPVVQVIMEHRKLNTLMARSVDPVIDMARKHRAAAAMAAGNDCLVFRIRGTFHQTATATGRLAMDEPNLQTVPRPLAYQVEDSQLFVGQPTGQSPPSRFHTPEDITSNIRAAFVAPPGCVLLSADYAQIELRLMAHFSEDTTLLAMLKDQGGQDPFRLLAARWQSNEVGMVTEQQRNHAKRLAYGLLYGMGPMALSKQMGISCKEAATLSDGFMRALPGVEKWRQKVLSECRSNGYVKMLLNRRRYLPDISLKGSGHAGKLRSAAERQAINTVCQGSAADLVKSAMIQLHHKLLLPGMAGAARMVLQVHDELVFEVRSADLARVAAMVKAEMEGVAPQLRVPLPVKLSAGPSWGELEELDLQLQRHCR